MDDKEEEDFNNKIESLKEELEKRREELNKDYARMANESAVHANLSAVETNKLIKTFYIIQLIMGVITLIVAIVSLRISYHSSEKEKLNDNSQLILQLIEVEKNQLLMQIKIDSLQKIITPGLLLLDNKYAR